jgi:hypothetical protein
MNRVGVAADVAHSGWETSLHGEIIAAFLDYLDYVVTRFAADHVAISADVACASRLAEAENKKIPRSGRCRAR